MSHTKPLRTAGPLALAFVAAGAAGNTPTPPQSQTRSFHVAAPCRLAMPLFTAEGERAWAPGWEPEILSGDGGRGSVFRTHAHGRETVWVVTDYQPEQGRASYARLAQGSNMGLVDVRCEDAPGGSAVSVTYTLTGISPEGRAFVAEFMDAQAYTDFIREWEQAIAAHLKARHGD